MMKVSRPKIERKIYFMVVLVAIVFILAGAVIDFWSFRDMKNMAGNQFNDEQLVIARNVKKILQRELDFLKNEIDLLTTEISEGPTDPQKLRPAIRKSLSRVLEIGVGKIVVADLKRRRFHNYTSYSYWPENKPEKEITAFVDSLNIPDTKKLWVSRPKITPSENSLLIGKYVPSDSARLAYIKLDITWFLSQRLRNIRSGKTGYAWIVDDEGVFLFHPDSDFIGQNAFKARKERHPDVSYTQIDIIQKEKMLKGLEGKSSYISSWHRGITGKIKKFIAYCPIHISENPSQNWSVAIAAPVSEIERYLEKRLVWRFLLQGIIISVIAMAAVAILFLEMRWSHVLEKKVNERTEELERSERKYRLLVESAEDFIFTLDREGRFRSFNSYTANFFGGNPEEIAGKRFASVFTGQSIEKMLKVFGLVCEYGKSLRDEFDFFIDDHKIWISANLIPIRDKKGNVGSVLCIARDITENKNLERQMFNTEKLASIGTLAAGVAHEINNPLGVMLGFCDLLIRKKTKGSEEYDDLKTIERQGLHCKQIVENLLCFARRGKQVSEFSDLNQCLEEITGIVRHTLEINDIELEMELEKNIPPVKGDARELQQVFLNLINNAAAAMKDGGKLNIRTFSDEKNQKVIIQFRDNGIGVREEDINHIFEPFFTTKPEGEGTGLGLSVSYGIITNYGGSIDCESSRTDGSMRSDKPCGTVFTVKMPVAGGRE